MNRALQAFADWPLRSESLADLYRRLCADEVPHAILLIGAPGESKKLTEYLAKLLVCTASPAPCGECAACRAVADGNHPDLHVVDGYAEGSVKTGAVGALQLRLSRRAHAGGRLVYVVLGIDTATPAAANRLLKTLEEPPAPVVALLTAASTRRVLPTVLSRCFTYSLDSGNLWEDPDPPRAVAVGAGAAEAGAGGAGADEAAGAGAGVAAEDPFAALVPAMIQWTRGSLTRSVAGLELADMFLKSTGGTNPADALHALSLWLRDVMHIRLGRSEYIRFTSYERDLEELAQLASAPAVAAVIEQVLDARVRLSAHVAPLLNLEQLCIRVQRGLANV